MFRFSYVFCAVLSLCHVQTLVWVMCSLSRFLGVWGSRIGFCRGPNKTLRGVGSQDSAYRDQYGSSGLGTGIGSKTFCLLTLAFLNTHICIFIHMSDVG